jgi:hypothetical protein
VEKGIERVGKQAEIFGGLFAGNVVQIATRWTWELPQSMLGYSWSSVRNDTHRVDVEYFDGATFVINETPDKWNGVTLGSFININSKYVPRDEKGHFSPQSYETQLYMHEYGHYLQSQEYGWGYLVSVGIPSIISAARSEKLSDKLSTHDIKWYERRANQKAADFFERVYPSWDETKYPINNPF